MSRSKSILLQVAFKEAVGATLGTDDSIAETTQSFYDMLIDLHESNGISIEDSGNSFRGNRSSKSKPLPEGVTQFTDANGQTWNDFRKAKAEGNVSAGHPDFKTTDYKQSEWLFTQEGTANEKAAELAAAADKLASLGSPM